MTGEKMLKKSVLNIRIGKIKRILLLTTALCFILLPVSCTEEENIHPLEKAFASLQIEAEKMRIVAWCCLVEDALTSDEMHYILDNVVMGLGAEIISKAGQNEDDYTTCTMLAKTEFAEYTLSIQSMPAESYMIILAELDAGQMSFSEAEAMLANAVGREYSINAFLSGSCNGNTKTEWKKQLTVAAAACSARIIEEAETETYYSLSVYCPFLPEFVMSEADAVNLQFAASYDEQAGKSFYYLGYPLLYNDY